MDAIASAVADPVRRTILAMLRSSPLPAGAIASRFTISRPAISRHLRVLRECGLVIDEPHGRERVYRVDLTPLAELQAWITTLVGGWEHTLDALATEVKRTSRDHRNTTPTRTHQEERTA
jgi:DNA-binding transcriptional ArsR family regulator